MTRVEVDLLVDERQTFLGLFYDFSTLHLNQLGVVEDCPVDGRDLSCDIATELFVARDREGGFFLADEHFVFGEFAVQFVLAHQTSLALLGDLPVVLVGDKRGLLEERLEVSEGPRQHIVVDDARHRNDALTSAGHLDAQLTFDISFCESEIDDQHAAFFGDYFLTEQKMFGAVAAAEAVHPNVSYPSG